MPPGGAGSTASALHSSNVSTSSYLSYPITRTVGSVLRRLSADPPGSRKVSPSPSVANLMAANFNERSYTPPRSTPPFTPPPLTPLALKSHGATNLILSRQLAEEVRLLVPTRLELVDTWALTFSLERDGSSLKTLYDKTDALRGKRGGFVLVVRDGSGNIFGAYLNEPPRPSGGHYYGTGECFLWRSTTLPAIPSMAWLPPPPSEDTTNAQRMTTVSSGTVKSHHTRAALGEGGNGTPTSAGSRSGTATPDRIRFKAFPYSGMNDYMIFCEHTFLSVGGGDGHYGLWLDSSLENGISDRCPTFGNEPLSDDGKKFDVLGVEVWYIGA